MNNSNFTLFDFEGERKDLISFKKALDDKGIISKIDKKIITVKCITRNEEGEMFEIKENFNVSWVK